jgi:hypothetical protein
MARVGAGASVGATGDISMVPSASREGERVTTAFGRPVMLSWVTAAW